MSHKDNILEQHQLVINIPGSAVQGHQDLWEIKQKNKQTSKWLQNSV